MIWEGPCLQAMSQHIQGIEPEEVFLYTPQGGRRDLRERWKERIVEETQAEISLPIVCSGLTHGLSICADLFVDAETTVLLPSPRWGNYDLIFGLRPNANIVNYNVLGGKGEIASWGWDLNALASALQQAKGRVVLVLNVPSNPLGYTPTATEIDGLMSILNAYKGRLTIVLDEAYHGMEWDDQCYKLSLLAN